MNSSNLDTIRHNEPLTFLCLMPKSSHDMRRYGMDKLAILMDKVIFQRTVTLT